MIVHCLLLLVENGWGFESLKITISICMWEGGRKAHLNINEAFAIGDRPSEFLDLFSFLLNLGIIITYNSTISIAVTSSSMGTKGSKYDVLILAEI